MKNTFSKRFGSMLKVDFKRLFLSRSFYIIVAACLLAPILILVMTTMMDGSVTVDPNTGVETVMEGFDNVWQIIGTVSGASEDASASMDMSITSMCNINMLYFAIAALVCIFVADDFRSGYAKNLFTVRAKKTDYVASKTLVLFVGSAFMMLAFVLGAILGGIFAGVSFEMVGFNVGNLIMSILAKILLCLIFVGIYLCMSVVAKQKLWLSILLSFGVGMFLFNIAPMVSPLNSGLLQVILCTAGGAGFAIGMGTISNLVLKKTSLV